MTLDCEMSAVHKNGADFKDYPYLDPEEFVEVCHEFDRRYSRATLGPVRRQWKLRICRALDLTLLSSVEYTTYVQIVRPLEGELDDGDLSKFLDGFSFDGASKEMAGTEDHEMMEAEGSDSVQLLFIYIPLSVQYSQVNRQSFIRHRDPRISGVSRMRFTSIQRIKPPAFGSACRDCP